MFLLARWSLGLTRIQECRECCDFCTLGPLFALRVKNRSIRKINTLARKRQLGSHGGLATGILKTDDIKSKKSILVVDDSQDTLAFNQMILEMEGYEVFTASRGEEALRTLSEIAKPDLILLDIRMEDMSGLEFLEILEKQNPEILEQVPVVFLTAMDQVPKSKAKGFIQKPIDIDNFLIAVRDYLDGGSAPDLDNRH